MFSQTEAIMINELLSIEKRKSKKETLAPSLDQTWSIGYGYQEQAYKNKLRIKCLFENTVKFRLIKKKANFIEDKIKKD